MSVAALIQTIKATPESEASLNLSGKNLGDLTGAELALVLAAIPMHVTSLNLSHNNLGMMTGDELATAFTNTCTTIKTLYLNHNDLKEIPLAKTFAALSSSIDSLHLSGNDLYLKASEKLAEAIDAIRPSVKILDLSHNKLDSKTVLELIERLSSVLDRMNIVSDEAGIQAIMQAKKDSELAVQESLPVKDVANIVLEYAQRFDPKSAAWNANFCFWKKAETQQSKAPQEDVIIFAPPVAVR